MSATPQDESDDGAAGGTGGANEPEPSAEEYLDGQEEDSFPASDPHSDWSGPPERT